MELGYLFTCLVNIYEILLCTKNLCNHWEYRSKHVDETNRFSAFLELMFLSGEKDNYV